MRVVNFFGGPDAGKSTMCAGLFFHLKLRGYNTEMALEYVKGAAWEGNRPKLFAAQDYIFGKQHWILQRMIKETDFVLTDSPLLLSLIYSQKFAQGKELQALALKTFKQYDNLNFFVIRGKKFNPAGRVHNEAESRIIDTEISTMLHAVNEPFHCINYSEEGVREAARIMTEKGWINYA